MITITPELLALSARLYPNEDPWKRAIQCVQNEAKQLARRQREEETEARLHDVPRRRQPAVALTSEDLRMCKLFGTDPAAVLAHKRELAQREVL